ESIVDAVPGELVVEGEGVVASTPTLGALDPGQGIQNGVDVGRDEQTVEPFVVADVDHHGQVDVGEGVEAPGQTGSTHSTGEFDHFHDRQDIAHGSRPVHNGRSDDLSLRSGSHD